MQRGFKHAKAVRKIRCVRRSTCRFAFNSVPFAGTLQKIHTGRRGIAKSVNLLALQDFSKYFAISVFFYVYAFHPSVKMTSDIIFRQSTKFFRIVAEIKIRAPARRSAAEQSKPLKLRFRKKGRLLT